MTPRERAGRVLLVEDNAGGAQLMRIAFGERLPRRRARGLRATASRRSARSIDGRPDWDLVLLDLNLPGVHGHDVLAAMRASERRALAPDADRRALALGGRERRRPLLRPRRQQPHRQAALARRAVRGRRDARPLLAGVVSLPELRRRGCARRGRPRCGRMSTPTQATGTPGGIWAIESSASRPPAIDFEDVSGTPITGSCGVGGDHARERGGQPGAGDDHAQAAHLRVAWRSRRPRPGRGARTSRGPRGGCRASRAPRRRRPSRPCRSWSP